MIWRSLFHSYAMNKFHEQPDDLVREPRLSRMYKMIGTAQ